MKFSKIFQYAYLVFAVLFLFDAIKVYKESGTIAYISLLFVALAIFMFFFRRRFANKYDNKNDSK